MTWLAWRQFRAQGYVAAAVLIAIAIALALTGPHLAHLYDTTVAPCAAHNDCASVRSIFLKKDPFLQGFNLLLLIVPALIGMFWGAPLIAREIESGSFRLAWTQSVTRDRWIATKLLMVATASMFSAGLLSLMVTWWSSPFDRLRDNPFGLFGQRDIAPIGYAAFALALGVVAGVLIRRTLPAMAATLIGYVAVRMAVTQWIRVKFATPIHATTVFQAPGQGSLVGQGLPSNPGDWVISSNTINAAGKVIGRSGGIGPNGEINFRQLANGATEFMGVGKCPNVIPPPPAGRGNVSTPSPAVQHAVQKCVNSFHLRDVLTYQPTSRYWSFQWYEFAIFLVMAAALAAFAWWKVRRRLS